MRGLSLLRILDCKCVFSLPYAARMPLQECTCGMDQVSKLAAAPYRESRWVPAHMRQRPRTALIRGLFLAIEPALCLHKYSCKLLCTWPTPQFIQLPAQAGKGTLTYPPQTPPACHHLAPTPRSLACPPSPPP